jgi:hypothetical protein
MFLADVWFRFRSSDRISLVYEWVLASGGTNGRGLNEFLLCTAVSCHLDAFV